MPEWFLQLGITGYPLALCAVIAGTVCIERSIFFLRNASRGNAIYQAIEQSLQQNSAKPKQVRDELVGFLLNQRQREMLSGIKWLRVIGVMSPMLGLLGTVLGMILAFKTIAATTGPVNPSLVADGLWEAMLTTAVGLVIALPSLLAAHIFKGLADRKLEQWLFKLNQLSLSYEGIQLGKAVHDESNIAPIKRKIA